ncbi:hypothetical protein DL95DRAFT_401076 [Leptodontidium sp. 2 PMI_412]|nr:hypothetical protein BKA61DRAFT_667104 [Leptodontidium sp. MPI-SDFR-AT-0119]KAH9223575.1 hypothetical protein DL95DRAFT_401076 [Leptodontidium sp. 2 PMI_412]
MKFKTFLLIAILAIIGATAPTRTIQPRACTTITPNAMQSLLSTDPTNGYTNRALDGPGVNGFSIFQDNTKANQRYQLLQFVDFEVPSNSYGCQLHVTDAGNSVDYSLIYGDEPSPNPGMARITVKSLVPNALPMHPTYNDVQTMNPSLISANKFGTFSIASGAQPRVINSQACPPAMIDGHNGHLQFVFELEDNDLSTTRYFSMTQRSARAGGGLNGVYMTFNC